MHQLWDIICEHPGFALGGVGVLLALLVRVLYWIACGCQALADAADRAFVFPPFRIRVEASETTQWTQDPAVQAVTNALRRLGFEDAGVYRIWEMPDTRVLFMAQVSARVSAAVYLMAGKVWLDLKIHFEDGQTLTLTNARMGASIHQRSGHPTVRHPEVTTDQLYDRIMEERAGRPLLAVAVASVAAGFQADYAAHADWQAERGGCTAEEIQGEVVASGARKLDASTLAYFRQKHAANALSNWWRGQPNPPYPWEEVKDDLVIVHDDLTLDTVVDLYTDYDLELGAKDVPSHLRSAREAFVALNENPKGQQPFTKVWEKTTGLAADFYLVFDAEEESQREAA